MKKILSLVAILALSVTIAHAEVIGIVDFDKVVDNYSKVKTVSNEISDKYAEIQRYSLDKEREYKKLSTPLERKSFEENVARELAKKQEAYLKLKEKKETEIDLAIKNAIKQVAIDTKTTTVVEKSVVFFGGVDLTDRVVKQLNSGSSK